MSTEGPDGRKSEDGPGVVSISTAPDWWVVRRVPDKPPKMFAVAAWGALRSGKVAPLEVVPGGTLEPIELREDEKLVYLPSEDPLRRLLREGAW